MLSSLILVAALGAPCEDGVCRVPAMAIVAAPLRVAVSLPVDAVARVVEAKPLRRLAQARPARRVVGRVARVFRNRQPARRVLLRR